MFYFLVMDNCVILNTVPANNFIFNIKIEIMNEIQFKSHNLSDF